MAKRWKDEDNTVDAALRGLNDDVPEMDARAFAAGRARLHAATGSPPLVHAGAVEREAVVVAMPPQPRRRSPPLHKAAPWAAAAAVVAVAALGVYALQRGEPNQAVTPGGSPPPGPTIATCAQPSSAPTVPTEPGPPAPIGKRPGEPLPPMPDKPCNSAGELAATVSDLPLLPGQYFYRRSENTQSADATGPGGTMTIELWVPQDQTADWSERMSSTGRIQGGNENGAPQDRRGPSDEFWRHSTSRWLPTPQNLASLPRDPAALYELVRAEVNKPLPDGTGTSNTAAFEAFDKLILGMFAFYPHVPADLRAAVFRTLGYLPDVVVTDNVRMKDGRSTVAIGCVNSDGSLRSDVLIDPATGRAIGHRNVALKEFQGYKVGQEITTSSSTDAVVDKIGKRPTG